LEKQTSVTIARQLFSVSPLKQRKLEMLRLMMDAPQGRTSLDVGSDNGVISLYLRDMGGEWYSADLIPETVEAIRELVSVRVDVVSADKFPYQDKFFDQILIVDFLEHIVNDSGCVQELARLLKPGGTLVVNVPNPKEGLLRKMRFLLGQTDQAHGHVRPGYDLAALEVLLKPDFEIERSLSYGKLFSELIDTVIVAGLDLLKGGKKGLKGTVVSASDLQKKAKSFKIYRIISPLLRLCMLGDSLLPYCHGNMLIVRARRR
jgi:SAM-dependent methyltransferase